MQRDLRETFLLQIGNDALAYQVAGPDDVQHLLVVVPQERQFESILGRIDSDGARACRAVEAVDCSSLHASEVDRVVEGSNHTSVAGK